MDFRKLFHFSIGPIGAALVGLISLPIVAWFFAPEDIGRLSILQVTISFSIQIFSLGLDQAYVREFHEYENKPGLLKSVMMPGLTVLCLFMLSLSLMPWAVSELLFGIDSVWLASLLYFLILVNFLSRFLSLILRMRERGLTYSMSLLLPKLVFLIMIIGYVWLEIETIFYNLMVAHAIAFTIILTMLLWATRNDWLHAFSASIDRSKQVRMMKYAIPLIGSGFAFWGLTAMDKFFLRHLSGFEELGVYAVASSFAGAALVFQSIFSSVWAPIVYRWAAKGNETRYIRDVVHYVTISVILIWALVGVFSWVLRYLIPPEYETVPTILLASIGYPLLYTLSEATGIGVSIKRKTKYILFAAIFALVVNLVGNWFLIPLYGAAGAAIASVLAFTTFFIVRTEASCCIWVKLDTKRMYALVFTMIIASVVVNIGDLDFSQVCLMYISFIFAVFFLYRYELVVAMKFIGARLQLL